MTTMMSNVVVFMGPRFLIVGLVGGVVTKPPSGDPEYSYPGSTGLRREVPTAGD